MRVWQPARRTTAAFAAACILTSCGYTQDEWNKQLAVYAQLDSEHKQLAEREQKLRAELEPGGGEVSSPPASGSARNMWPDVSAPLHSVGDSSNDAALIVAIENYAFLSDVPGAHRNGLDWFTFLTKVRKMPVTRTRVLFNGDATDYAIRSNLKEVAAEVGAGGKLWFIFIGHGAPSESERDGLLVAVDAQQTAAGIERRSVLQREVFSLVGQCVGTPVLILDACYSGRDPSGQALVAGLQPSVVVSTAVPPEAIVLSAAGSNEFAGALPGEERPAFSYLALGGLRGWADEDGNGNVTGAEVASYAKDTLRVLLGPSRSQTPQARGQSSAVISLAAEHGPDLGGLVLALRRGL
jgi:hypothetical protein